MSAKRPGQSLRYAKELAEDFSRFLAGEPIKRGRASAVERSWRWCKRKPAVAALTGVLILTAAVAVGLVTWLWRDAESMPA